MPQPVTSHHPSTAPDRRVPRLHPAWIVAAVTAIALIGAAGFRATPGVFIEPLEAEFGWSRSTISSAISINLLLYGLTAPFAAALMERFGIRRVVSCALVLVAAGSGLTVFMTSSWQLITCWGFLVGLGTGSLALAFAATVAGRWFVKHRGLVTGVLTACGAAGQLVFLPLLAALVGGYGWRWAAATVAGASLLVVPLVLLFLRERPADLGLRPYGEVEAPAPAAEPAGTPARIGALNTLSLAVRSRAFWCLAGGFAICGATTNGLIQVHFIPAAHDHGMGQQMAAGLLALVGIFDVAGTVLSGWLTDRVPAWVLLLFYYGLRGLSLVLLPHVLEATTNPSLVIFIVFYGLDWVATVPPTIAICRQVFGARGPIVFGWVFASHQVGAALAATAAAWSREQFHTYTVAFTAAGVLCLVAVALSAGLARARPHPDVTPT